MYGNNKYTKQSAAIAVHLMYRILYISSNVVIDSSRTNVSKGSAYSAVYCIIHTKYIYELIQQHGIMISVRRMSVNKRPLPLIYVPYVTVYSMSICW